jgi:hypothetical protein
VDGPDELLDEPLLLNGAFIRRWDEFSRLPRPDDTGGAGLLSRKPDGGTAVGHGDVPAPRTPAPFERAGEPADD